MDLMKMLRKLPQGQERAKEEVETTSVKPHPVAGIKQFLGLGLVMLNLDSVTKKPQLIGGQRGNKSFKNLSLSISRG